MKRLLLTAGLSVAILSLCTAQASAGLFGCFKCNKCGTFCVKPYNAFSPVCFGSVCCEGFNPLSSGACNPGLQIHGSPACGGGHCFNQLPAMQSWEPQAQSAMAAPTVQPPMPPAMPARPFANVPYTGPVQPAGYQPSNYGYPPAQNFGYMPVPAMSAPAYWYPR